MIIYSRNFKVAFVFMIPSGFNHQGSIRQDEIIEISG